MYCFYRAIIKQWYLNLKKKTMLRHVVVLKYRDTLIRIFNKKRLFSDTRPVNVLCNINVLSVKTIVCQRKANCLCVLCTYKCVSRLKFWGMTTHSFIKLVNMFKYYTGNMAIIIDQYGPIFMIYHNMCDGCTDKRMDVHTDRRMSRRTDEITCVTLYYPITLE